MNWPEQDLNPATTFGMLRGREEELGHAPDHLVMALTDLPSTPTTLCDGKSPVDDAAIERVRIGISPVISRVLGW